MRPGCLIAAGVVALGAISVLLVMAVFGRGDGAIALGNVADYEPGSVVYRSTDGLFVVRLPGGAMIALSDVDPHNPPGRRSCRVAFRPDLAAGGEAGRFFDGCTGAMYDIAGSGLQGDGLDLRSIPVSKNEAGDLTVRPEH